MKTVTVDELREKLPELLDRIAAGEKLVITDGGRWVAALAPPPPPPPTPEEEAERQAKIDAFIRWAVQRQLESGVPLPADDPLRKYLTAEGAA